MMTAALPVLPRRFSVLFTVLLASSLALMATHVLDDAFNVGEADWWGVSAAEFILFNIQLYLFVPPFGWLLARRARALGFFIVLLYALQAFYGGGVNHVRHLMGEFGGSQMLPSILRALNIDIGPVPGRGWLTGVFWFFGLGTTPPHSHSSFSNYVVFAAIPVNFALILACLAGLWIAWRRPRERSV